MKGFKFPNKRADDLFVRSNSDGDTTISCEEFVEIYQKELNDRAEKRHKMAQNLLRLDARSQGWMHKLRRLFCGSSNRLKSITDNLNLDSYNTQMLKNEMLELQKFELKVEKNEKKSKSSGFVLDNKSTKLAIEDYDDVENINNFFAVFGRKQKAEETMDEALELVDLDIN